ncbi:hypothetical protein F5Y09DRAFT_346204 [Xylaria sp. FL1042]|nr:hypothetical protein F5Y09DRAFT_346204 [Xylaria sp. FL1042]
MSSFPPGCCLITYIPYELRRMILAELSDDSYDVRALARTCTQFYDIYRHDQKARIQYSIARTKRLIGCNSPSLVRLCLLSLWAKRFRSFPPSLTSTSSEPGSLSQKYRPGLKDYYRQNWVFTHSDFQLVKTIEFETELRTIRLCAKRGRERGWVDTLRLPDIFRESNAVLHSWLQFDPEILPDAPLTVRELEGCAVLMIVLRFRTVGLHFGYIGRVLERWEPKPGEWTKLLDKELE